jgi:hypothetical protein
MIPKIMRLGGACRCLLAVQGVPTLRNEDGDQGGPAPAPFDADEPEVFQFLQCPPFLSPRHSNPGQGDVGESDRPAFRLPVLEKQEESYPVRADTMRRLESVGPHLRQDWSGCA